MSKNRQFYKLAIKAALKAGKLHKKFQSKGTFRIESKGLNYDLVTESDLEAEKLISTMIHHHFPDHNIQGEEQHYTVTESPYTWIIDPLDGTNNFSRGLPQYSVSIALAFKGQVVVGVVYDPSRKELFSSIRGGGAYLNGRPIKVSEQNVLKTSMAITGFYYDRGDKMKRALRQIETLFSHDILGLRRFGSAAIDIVYVAAGRADMFWEYELSPWDYAAASLILEEAGGQLSDYNGENPDLKRGPIVATNRRLHQLLLELLTKE
ncbi:inositol monophosphatase family protein [Spirochaeta cellobiosiphila]|uniref:inositol monophosphatase family protein n=1 Tax=Spirochaeta cellobiosiphila TaxID=504483 RepID=UPI0003FC6341|nr:inositol monophosphatase family protein [Spirochaeta cellobiosiphila]